MCVLPHKVTLFTTDANPVNGVKTRLALRGSPVVLVE
jgi:hypothetical protein